MRKIEREMIAPHALRYWPLENCELFFRSRHGLVRTQESAGLARFEVSRESYSPNRLLTDSDTFSDTLQKIIEQSHDKIEAVLRWLRQSEREQGWHTVQWPWGTHDELRNLLRAMAVLVRQPEHENFLWQCEVRPDFRSGIILRKPYSHHAIPKRAFYRTFLLYLSDNFPAVSESVTLYNRNGVEAGQIWPLVELSSGMPSQHEKLEALLTWRDFLRDKIPAAEIDELLRPFC